MQSSRTVKTRKKSETWAKHGRRWIMGINLWRMRFFRKRSLPLEVVDMSKADWSSNGRRRR